MREYEKERTYFEDKEEKESTGIERYRMIYREVRAEEIGGISVPGLAGLQREEEEDLKAAGVKDLNMVHRFLARKHDKILRRWRSELSALGSLMDPNERKRVETEVEEGLRIELEKAINTR